MRTANKHEEEAEEQQKEAVCLPPKREKKTRNISNNTDFITMPRRARKEAVQTNLDSEEEFTLSSEEEGEYDDERLHFEERFDPAEDTVSDE